MKKNLNIIQIKGIKGIFIAIFVVSCLIAGFVIFPGFVFMHIWNLISSYQAEIPSIGIIQGTLLWGIIVASYFTFKKDRFIICVKSPQGLSEDELKAVFANIKEQAEEDIILKTMIEARETELKIKSEQAELSTTEQCEQVNKSHQ
ncbi:hypothetical protein IJO12_02555 [bacterium]|nr:hypothetical protein [bacterium]